MNTSSLVSVGFEIQRKVNGKWKRLDVKGYSADVGGMYAVGFLPQLAIDIGCFVHDLRVAEVMGDCDDPSNYDATDAEWREAAKA